MARREWAEREAAKLIKQLGCNRPQDVPRSGPIELAYLAEHARAVRVVKATRKRVAQDTATYNDVERIIIDVVLQGLMDDLQKGRA